MKYKSTNALSEFSFQEASIASMESHLGSFILDLDNVTILSTNSHNRDIQDMRANNVTVTFSNATIEQITSEGYKVYDADGNFQRKENYTECVAKYIECVDEESGMYPLTEDLQYIIQNSGAHNGWWKLDGNYIFRNDNGENVPGINSEIAWLFMCCYIQG